MDAANYNNDHLFEILMRVDPADIFNCILVAKDWLEVITSQGFRTKYLNRWNGKLLVGLLMFDQLSTVPRPEIMLPTNRLGLQLNDNTLIPERSRLGSFVSKSPNSSHALFISISRLPSARTLSVWTGGPTVVSTLPPPPVKYMFFVANILCDDDDADSFKVILADVIKGREENTVNIQIFSSSTGQWEQSKLTCSLSFRLRQDHGKGSGIVTRSGGSICWEACSRCMQCLAVWDMNAGSRLSLILEPGSCSLLRALFYEGQEMWKENSEEPASPGADDFSTYYGVSPNGSLLSATCSFDSPHPCDYSLWKIKIFEVDENTKDWKLLHNLRHGDIWTNNLALLSYLFGHGAGAVPPNGFVFVSFLPGRLDSILVGLEQHLFMCNLENQKLTHLDYLKYVYYLPHGRKFMRNTAYQPLTLKDLGAWLSSPPSINHEEGGSTD